MIDHLGFSVSDYERAKAFYAKALAPQDSAPAASRISGSAAKAR